MKNDIRHDVLIANSRFRVRGDSMLPTFRTGDEVIVEPVSTDALVPGDFVFITTGNQSYVHRYLGQKKKGYVTKGDGHRTPDPLWDNPALRGRVIKAWRKTERIYTRTPGTIRRNRLLAYQHRLTGLIWGYLASVKAILTTLIFCFLISSMVISAVTLADFKLEPGLQNIVVKWETASEVGNLGFYLWRSESELTGYYKLPISDPNHQFIPSQDEGAGYFYDYVDIEVTPRVLYYYKLQDYPAQAGAEGEYSLTLSAGIGLETATPTSTPKLTPTATPTQNIDLTSTPTPQPGDPSVLFWSDKEQFPAGECVTLQWQTANVKAVYLNGEGVAGFGAKSFCPCADEIHTLTVNYPDNSRHDYTVNLSVTGECDPQLVNSTITPTSTAPQPSENSPAATATPQPLSMPVNTRTPVPARSTITPKPPIPTPAYAATADNSEPDLTPTAIRKDTPTPTRVIVQGQNPRQPILGEATGLLIFAALAGFSLIGVGIWLWRRH